MIIIKNMIRRLRKNSPTLGHHDQSQLRLFLAVNNFQQFRVVRPLTMRNQPAWSSLPPIYDARVLVGTNAHSFVLKSFAYTCAWIQPCSGRILLRMQKYKST